MGYRVQLPPRQPATPPLAGSPISEKPVTLVTGGNRLAALPLRLDPKTVMEALGDRPDPGALQALTAEVAGALAGLQGEIRSGQLGPGPMLVRGRPLADWLPLETVAAWLGRAGKAQRTAR